MKKALIFLWQLFLLCLIYAASDFIVEILHLPLPASVLGMMILFILLLTGAVKVSQIEKGAAFLNRHLAFFFIPIAVGLMSYGGLIRTSGWQLLIMIIGSTVIGLVITSGLAAYFSGRGQKRVSGITLISILLTIIVYIGAKALSARLLSPFATPVFTATAVMIILLLAGGITYEEYMPAKNIMTFMLGPATVSLAVPLYHNRLVIRERLKPAVIGLTAGTLSTITSAVLLAKVLGLPEKIQATSAVKAITTPVAIEAAQIIGGDPPLAAVFVISAGIFGAVMGSVILSFLRISEPFARGLGIGTVAHGIGTSQAAIEDPVQGAVSSAAMGFSAILTSLVIPWFYPLLQLLL